MADTVAAEESNNTKIKVEKNTPPIPSNDYEPRKPKILSKAKFCMAYEVTASLKYVVVERFNAQLFVYPGFQEWAKKAEEYSVYTCNKSGSRYASVDVGEEAYVNLTQCLANEDCEVCHPRFNKGIQWILQATDTGLGGLMRQLYQTKNVREDIFGYRTVIVEHMPQCTSEELLEIFPEATNIVNFTLDDFIRDSVVVELNSKTEADAFVEQFNGAAVKDQTICANIFLPRIQKMLDCFKKFNKKYGVDSELTDETRLENVVEFVKLQDDKEAVLNSTDIRAYDKERRFFEIEKQWDPLQRTLFSDAKRRLDSNIPLAEKPEDVPESMQKLVFGKGVLDKRQTHREASLRMEEEKRKKKSQEVDAKIRQAELASGGAMLIPRTAVRVVSKENNGKEMIPVPKRGGLKRSSASALHHAAKAFKGRDQYDSTSTNSVMMEPHKTRYPEHVGHSDRLLQPDRSSGHYSESRRAGDQRSYRDKYHRQSICGPLLSPVPSLMRESVPLTGDFRDADYPYRGGYGQPQGAVHYEQDVLESKVKALTDHVMELKAAVLPARQEDRGVGMHGRSGYGSRDQYASSSYNLPHTAYPQDRHNRDLIPSGRRR